MSRTALLDFQTNRLFSVAAGVVLLGLFGAVGVDPAILTTVASLGLVGGLFGTGEDAETIADRIDDRLEGELDALETDRDDDVGRVHSQVESLLDERRELHQRVDELERELEQKDRRTERVEAYLDDYSDVMQTCAAGNLVQRMDETDEPIAVGEDFNAMMDELERAMQQLKAFVSLVVDNSEQVVSGTTEVSTASDTIAESINEISTGASRQTARLEELNSEMETLSSNVQEVAATADQVSTLSEQTAKAGREGREAASGAMQGMDEIEDEADAAVDAIEDLRSEMAEIEEITDFITDIAEQTNMLALNANIEASRGGAGDGDGAGFAVVAQEVKDLAEETKDAAEDIEGRLQRIQNKTEMASETVTRTSQRVTQNREDVEAAAAALDQIAEYAAETNEGVQDISRAATGQAQSSQQVVSLAEETASISEQTAGLSTEVAAAAEEQTATLAEVSESAEDLATNAQWLSDTLDMFKVSQSDSEEALLAGADGETTEAVADDSIAVETTVGTGSARGDDSRTVAASAARRAFDQLDTERVVFCLVFCSPSYEFGAVVDGVRAVIGDDAKLIGCSSSGEFTERTVGNQTITVGLVTSDKIKFYTGVGEHLTEGVPEAIGAATESFPESVEGYPHRTAINLHDGLSGLGDQIALVTQRNLGHDVNFAGGSAGDDMNMAATHVFHGDEVYQDAVVMGLMASTEPIAITVNHGHAPISEPVTVTKAEAGRVFELDGRPAFEVWREAVEDHVAQYRSDEIDIDAIEPGSKELLDLLSEYEFGIDEGDGAANGEYKIRWPGLSNDKAGPLDFAVNVPEGTELRVMYSPKDDQVEAARGTAREAVETAEFDEIAGGFVYDCACRAIILEDDFGEAVKAMAQEIDAPFAGIETYGELCMERGQTSGYHNTTNVVMLLPK